MLRASKIWQDIRGLWRRQRARARFPENPALDKAMHAVALSDNPQTRASLYKELLQSTLAAPGSVDHHNWPARQSAVPQSRVSLRTVSLPNGNLALPVFTGKKSFFNFYNEDSPWVAMPAPALFKSISGGSITEVRLNPFPTGRKLLAPGGILFKTEFEALADGLIPKLWTYDRENRTFELQSPIRILETAKAPSHPLPGKVYFLVEQALRSCPEVKAAFHFDVQPATGIQRPAVGFQFSGAPQPELVKHVVSTVAKRLKEYDDLNFGLDLFELAPNQAALISGIVQPFYRAN